MRQHQFTRRNRLGFVVATGLTCFACGVVGAQPVVVTYNPFDVIEPVDPSTPSETCYRIVTPTADLNFFRTTNLSVLSPDGGEFVGFAGVTEGSQRRFRAGRWEWEIETFVTDIAPQCDPEFFQPSAIDVSDLVSVGTGLSRWYLTQKNVYIRSSHHLFNLPDVESQNAVAMSNDATAIIVTTAFGQQTPAEEIVTYRWSPGVQGDFTQVAPPIGTGTLVAHIGADISGDGSVLVGNRTTNPTALASSDQSFADQSGFIWTSTTGYSLLPSTGVLGNPYRVVGVSADGNAVFGIVLLAGDTRGFVHFRSTAMTSIIKPPSECSTVNVFLTAANFDGSRVVGYISSQDPTRDTSAIIASPSAGIAEVRPCLLADVVGAVSLNGRSLQPGLSFSGDPDSGAPVAVDISDDGLTFLVRWKEANSDFYVDLAIAFDSPPTCTGTSSVCPNLPVCDSIDFNGDGLFPDDQDTVDFLSVLAGGACSTSTCGDLDFNNDGLFPDDQDLADFLTVLAGGTPISCL